MQEGEMEEFVMTNQRAVPQIVHSVVAVAGLDSIQTEQVQLAPAPLEAGFTPAAAQSNALTGGGEGFATAGFLKSNVGREDLGKVCASFSAFMCCSDVGYTKARILNTNVGKESTGAESATALEETGDGGLGVEPLGGESTGSLGGVEVEGRFTKMSLSSMTVVPISDGDGISNFSVGAREGADGGVGGVDGLPTSG